MRCGVKDGDDAADGLKLDDEFIASCGSDGGEEDLDDEQQFGGAVPVFLAGVAAEIIVLDDCQRVVSKQKV